MSDDLTKKEPQDGNKINIHETWELAYWTKHFEVTKEQLIAAVKVVGTSKLAVQKHLGK